MPITITPSSLPPTTIGYNVFAQAASSFIGPLPTGSFFIITVATNSDATHIVMSATYPTSSPIVGIQFGAKRDNWLVGNYAVADGETVYVQSQLFDNHSVEQDASTSTFTWSHTSNEPTWIVENASGAGLTTSQAAQLTRVDTATQIPITRPTGITTVPLSQLLASVTLDAVTLVEQTSGPTFGFVGVTVPTEAIGLIVRITTVGPGYTPTTPDSGWYAPDLAVINFFRGSDLVGRIGMHEVSRFVYPLPGAWEWWTSLLFGGTIPPDYSIQVTFANGNAGRVYLTRLP